MALSVAKGTITVTSTGNQTIGSLDNPKAIIMWGTAQAATGTSAAAAHNSFGIGFGTYRSSTVVQCSKCMGSLTTDPGSSGGGRHSDTSSLFTTCNDDGAIDCEIDLVSMDADEVVINVANLDTTASIIVHYLILGGSDLTDALVVNSTTSTSSPQDVSGTSGFGQPDLVCVIGAKSSGDTTTDPALSVGWGIKDGAQVVHNWMSDDAGSVQLGCYQRADRIYSSGIVAGPTLDAEASLAASSGWPTDGIELTWNDVAPDATDHLGILFLKGTFQKAVAVADQPTAGAPQDQDHALAFTPKGVITHTLSVPGLTTYQTSGTDLGSFTMGASDGTNEGASLYMDGDAEATQRVRMRLSTDKAIEMMSQSGTTSTLVAAADAVFQTNNLRFTWTTTNATARQYIYVVFGDAAAAGDFPLDAQPGAYSVSGSLAGALAARAINSAPGTYAVTGLQASVVAGRIVSADPGSYAVSGSVAGLLADRIVGAAPGAYTLTGLDADLVLRILSLNAEPGSYALTGIDAALTLVGQIFLDAQPGSYALTGLASGLAAAKLFAAEPGTYALTGSQAGVAAGRVVNAASGAYVLLGAPTGTLAARLIVGSSGSYELTGFEAGLGDVIVTIHFDLATPAGGTNVGTPGAAGYEPGSPEGDTDEGSPDATLYDSPTPGKVLV